VFMRLVHATSVAFFREKTNATEVACTSYLLDTTLTRR